MEFTLEMKGGKHIEGQVLNNLLKKKGLKAKQYRSSSPLGLTPYEKIGLETKIPVGSVVNVEGPAKSMKKLKFLLTIEIEVKKTYHLIV